MSATGDAPRRVRLQQIANLHVPRPRTLAAHASGMASPPIQAGAPSVPPRFGPRRAVHHSTDSMACVANVCKEFIRACVYGKRPLIVRQRCTEKLIFVVHFGRSTHPLAPPPNKHAVPCAPARPSPQHTRVTAPRAIRSRLSDQYTFRTTDSDFTLVLRGSTFRSELRNQDP